MFFARYMRKKSGSQVGPLSRWVLVHPHVVLQFAAFVKDSLKHTGGLPEFSPKPHQWHQLKAFGAQHAVNDRSSVIILHQYSGDRVLIPPGWPHAVVNLLPCLKITHVYCKRECLATCTAVQRDVFSPLFKGDFVTDDYMGTAHIVSQGMEQLFDQRFPLT